MRQSKILAVSSILGSTLAATTSSSICPVLGQQWPVPTGLSKEPTFQAAANALTAKLNSELSSNGFNSTTFSVSVFSASEDGLSYQYHHTDGSVANSTSGVKTVNADSIYRVGSISKLLTMYIFLQQEGWKHLNDPITDYIPELARVNITQHELDQTVPDWESTSVSELASHLGGLPREWAVDLTEPLLKSIADLPPGALPPLPKSDIPPCGYPDDSGIVGCTNQEWLAGVSQIQPIFQNSYTPIYSNDGISLIGIGMENAANSTMDQLFDKYLVNKLDLTGSSADVPRTVKNGVIPINATISAWNNRLGTLNPAGGYFASSNDLAKIGKSILNSTLLPKADTRRWLKPSTFLQDFASSVGIPWEIFRVRLSGQSVDLYTKSGDWGAYHTFFGIVPDYGIGFSVLSAVNPIIDVESVREEAAEIVASIMLPAISEIAREQAIRNFVGTYTSTSPNSSVTISTDDVEGLKVTGWISNGTDLWRDLISPEYGSNADFRLLPNLLYDGNKVGFTGSIQTPGADQNPVSSGELGNFFWPCPQWASVGSFLYGSVDITMLVFEVDDRGRATSVRSKGLRTTMKRESPAGY